MPNLRSFNAKAVEPGGLFQEQHRDYDHANEMRAIKINWDRLMAKRYQVIRSVENMPSYLLKPEVNRLLDLEVDPQYRLLIDLLWSTGGRVSEVLALTKERFVYDGYDFQVVLQTLKSPGRPKKKAERRSAKRFIPICDKAVQNRIQEYIFLNKLKKGERLFPMCRQTVDRRIKRLVKRAGGAPFRISSHTFRHSFAIHLLLHACPLKYVSQLLGHRSIESTEIYTNVLTVDGSHFLEGVDFH